MIESVPFQMIHRIAVVSLATGALFLSVSLPQARAGRPNASAATRAATPAAGFTIQVGTPTASPTAAPTPAPSALLPPVYYQNGPRVYAAYPDGSGAVLVATLPVSATVRPQLLPDGRLLYEANVAASTFAAVDRFGRGSGIRTPDLSLGETVWSVAPSPDGRSLAWQLFAPLPLPSYVLSTGVGRVVLTGRFGEGGATLFTTRADARLGATQALLGWRASSSYGSGDPTLLLQDLYGSVDTADGVGLNTVRGLIEYDPAIADIVNDYLPPLISDVPPRRALTVSADGTWTVYGDANSFTPSGDGPPLARRLAALDLNTNKDIALDTAGRYPTKRTLTQTVRRKVGTRVVTTRISTGTLRLYQYFSHNVYVAPGDGRTLYTRLTISYPRGARLPQVEHSALVATMDGKSRKAIVSGDVEGAGWLDSHTAVVKRAGGLYSVNVDSGAMMKLASGAPGSLYFIGVRTR